MPRSFCWVRQRRACCGRLNSAERARSAVCRSRNAATSSSSTRFNERSTRYGGQNTVTVPWLLPAKRATAAAVANRTRSQRAARIGPSSASRAGGGQRRERLVDAGHAHRAQLRLHLLQRGGHRRCPARTRIEIAVQ